jgi:TfoX/Sxy family transcriptional regulator of competence genes
MNKVVSDKLAIEPAFAPIVAAFARDRQVKVGRMFSSSSVLNVNGKIFAMYVKGKFVAKLPKQRVNELVSSGAGEFFDTGRGRLMKEWVAIQGRSATWVALAREAHAFVKEKAK